MLLNRISFIERIHLTKKNIIPMDMNIIHTEKSYYQKVSSNYGQGGNIESRLGIGTGFDEMNRLPIIRTAKNPSSKTD